MIILAYCNDYGHGLVVLELVAHIDIPLSAILPALFAFLVIPLVPVELRLNRVVHTHHGSFFTALKSVKKSHRAPPNSPCSEGIVPISYRAGTTKPIASSVSIAAAPRAFKKSRCETTTFRIYCFSPPS